MYEAAKLERIKNRRKGAKVISRESRDVDHI